MRQRTTNESKPVGLFPFLAVLLCTMGALLVLLVVLAQRAGERVAAQQAEPPQATEPLPSGPSEPIALQEPQTLPDNDIEGIDIESNDPGNDIEAEALAEQLAKAHAYQEKLSKLREQAAARLEKEQLRLSHLEEHARRIEHELARLAIAVKQLEATEKNQTVDQQQAESELVHLRELIKETEEQLEKLRDEVEVGQRSYAIVPYKGPNGTYRRPVYIECTKEGVTIQPEGIRFTSSDFAAPGWAGNPLAAALRASREYLNAKAAAAGLPEPPDPYPLLIVRPDGIAQYQVARTALAAWDADFGYEFVDSDWNLEYPDLPDPRLAQIQHHAQLTAREQLSRLVRSAPSRFRGVGLGGSNSTTAGGNSGSHRYGAGGQSSESNEYGALAQSSEGKFSGGGSAANGQSLTEAETATGDFQYGAFSGDAGGDGSASQNGASGSESSETFAELSASNEGSGSNPSEGSGSNLSEGEGLGGEGIQAPGAGTESSDLAQSASQSAGGSSSGGSSSTGSSSGGAASGAPPSGPTDNAPNLSMSNQSIESIAESQGKNWAVSKKAPGALPIRRPIQLVVRKDRLALLPSRHATGGIAATGSVISLNQSAKQISEEFVGALKTRVDQWGLAGNGLYWRPVLELHIGPEAEGTARGIAKLLLHSGVEVHRSETAATGTSNQALKGDLDHATR